MNRASVAALALVCSLSVPSLRAQNAPNAPKASPDLFAASRKARADGRYGMLLSQFRADEPTLAEHHEAGKKPATARYQNARDVPEGYWVWQKPFWFVFRDGPDTVVECRRWGAERACGAPDTTNAGDQDTAWAMLDQDAKDEWLLLEYASPVRVTAIEVHENFNPGAIASVSIFTPDGEELELWRNNDVKPANEAARVLQVDIPIGFAVERVKLRFASELVPGWNEIDAVGLRDDKGKVHWASRASASSTYADAVAPAQAPGGGQVFIGGWQVQRIAQVQVPQVQLAPVQIELPRLVVQAREVRAAVTFQKAQVENLRVDLLRAPAAAADGDENTKLRQRVAELEAKVRQLEAELARKNAGK
jgi:hypothetical protein